MRLTADVASLARSPSEEVHLTASPAYVASTAKAANTRQVHSASCPVSAQVVYEIPTPGPVARMEILKYHARNKKLDKEPLLIKVAELTQARKGVGRRAGAAKTGRPVWAQSCCGSRTEDHNIGTGTARQVDLNHGLLTLSFFSARQCLLQVYMWCSPPRSHRQPSLQG